MVERFPAYSGRGHYVFVSYAHKNSKTVYPIISTLHDMGYNIWYDEGIPLVEKYGSILFHRIRECSVFLLFVSKDSVSSQDVNKEVENAFGLKKTVVRINIDESPLPDSWAFHLPSTSQFMSVNEEPSIFYKKLCDAIAICRGETPVRPTYTPVRVPTPQPEAISAIKKAVNAIETSNDNANRFIRTLVIVACLALIIGVTAIISSGIARSSGSGGTTSNPPEGVTPPQGSVEVYDDNDYTDDTPSIAYSAGDIITLGSYEQDGDKSNGAEPLEWLVLETEDGRAMLLSLYAIDVQPYHSNRDNKRTWANCDLNDWLDETFYNDAFTAAEKSRILNTKISTPNNPDYGTSGGSDSYDKVFILSVDEARSFFTTNERIARPTWQTRILGGYADNKHDDVCWWWLRSTGENGWKACYVDEFGNIGTEGNWIDLEISVRPAIYVEN